VEALRVSGRAGLRVKTGEGILAWAHDELLERVIAHLVQNAFDASGATPDVEIQVERDGNAVLIVVTDHGAGMTPEFMRERLFRPFQTTKNSGMGIGAFECQQYVQRVGGQIDVASVLGQGTRISIRLRGVEQAEADRMVAA
jgi:signal transduction histidine kinase